MDPELLTGPQRAEREAEQARKAEELRGEKARVRSELENARQNGAPTKLLESEIENFDARIAALYRPPPWDPIHLSWPKLRAHTAEIRQLTTGGEPLSLQGAQRLVDMLYTDIEPRLNVNLQLAVFLGIQQCSEANLLTDDVRRFLRDSLLDYFNATRDQCDEANKGPMCKPYSMLFLAQAISVVTTSDDGEASEAFEHLRTRAIQKCAALQWEREKILFEGMFSMFEDAFKLRSEDVNSVADISQDRLSEEDIAKLLRTYRKILSAPPRRLRPEVLVVIDRNLLGLAERKLGRKNWELWAEAAIQLGPRRASAAMRNYLAPRKDSQQDDAQSDALRKARQVYARFQENGQQAK